MASLLEISKSFETRSETISDFFEQAGLAYYIPLYQREYSWDAVNVNQLMEDICRGVTNLIDDPGTIHFMGAVILLRENDVARNIQPQDHRALPVAIDNVIDGQQRITTLALLACVLYQRIYELVRKLPKDEVYDGLREEAKIRTSLLLNMFSEDLKRGYPSRKPIVIRGSVDGWALSDPTDASYKSDFSKYIAKVIRAISEAEKSGGVASFPARPKSSLVGSNLRLMLQWLKRVEDSHEEDGNEDDEEFFPTAWSILEKIEQRHVWSYDRPELKSIVTNRSDPLTKHEKIVCSLVQLFSFCHFLFRCCCLTLIKPVRETWAFDMFQSLNATGTPLTAVETFKPLVVNKFGGTFKGSAAEGNLQRVDKLLDAFKSAVQKGKLTNEVLTTFALAYDGSKLGKQFSVQRAKLIQWFNACETQEARDEFLRIFGDLADYWLRIVQFDRSKPQPLNELTDSTEAPLATLCCLYLQDAGHRMANTILSRFYSPVLREEEGAVDDFVAASEAVAAFFTLWRSSHSNRGLDDVYRVLMRGAATEPAFSWKSDVRPTVGSLKSFFRAKLAEKGIAAKADWMPRAQEYCSYDHATSVCKFMLLICAHDTMADPAEPGLMKAAKAGTSPNYLRPESWVSLDFNSIEHVAPRSQSGTAWDAAFYELDRVHRIGNLSLLPTEINCSASNRGWAEKLIYYKHLAEPDLDATKELSQEAESLGIALSDSTITMLREATHKHHIVPLVNIPTTGVWDWAFVERRTERICSLTWDRLWPWLA
ncbi:DUF262 domain-containing protein [Aquisphaera insulae]|uniref:DUF262 domain-containing protein n=1 Tax=Aquisphaera insulae TaxID=2712864 RepID=UPI0013EA9FE9|nr:DUF262 domain-containing HNH endonuclease family protein [Aquisphaera insulae]